MNPTVKNSSIRLSIDQTRARQTPKTDFGTVMKAGLNKAADVTLTGASIAAPFIPGGSVVTAAVSGVQQMRGAVSTGLESSGGGMSLGSTGVGTPVAPGVAGSGGVAPGASVVGGPNQLVNQTASTGSSSTDALMSQTRAMQEMNMSFNLQYLNLQQNMQQENRQFTMMSNIMKTKHDTAKSAINNIR